MLSLAGFVSFHVEGRRIQIKDKPQETLNFTNSTNFENDPNGTYHIEQAYVQYFIPAERKFGVSLLLVHGGGMTGVNWETTPDGPSGWLHRFFKAGFAIYSIDNVERGRTGWCALENQWEGKPISRSEEQAWALFRLGEKENFSSRQTFKHMQFPIEAIENFTKLFVPRWSTTTNIMGQGIIAALERIGPCAVICHSQGGDLSLEMIITSPNLVRHVITLEPSDFPNPISATEPVKQHWLFIMGDNIEVNPFWASLMEQTNFVVNGFTTVGSEASFLHLPKQGVPGNTHMLMMDRNSNQIADLTVDWLSQGI